MRPRDVIALAVAAAVLAAGATGVAVSVARDELRHHGSPVAGARGAAMPGMMRGASVGSEYEFLARVVVHHDEAVASARQLERSERAAMRTFGRSIVRSQSAQIDQWLVSNQPVRGPRNVNRSAPGLGGRGGADGRGQGR